MIACLVGGAIALSIAVPQARTSDSATTSKSTSSSAGAEEARATDSVVSAANQLTISITHAREETSTVLASSFAALARSQRTVAAERSQLAAERDLDSGVLRVVVEDSGHGIPTREREAALQRFARPGARDAGGSGLGLAIAKAVAMAHGGSISIDQSPLLGGARVAIVIPAMNVLATTAH
jgi:two-component system OmpR family sensor kinase